MDFSLTSSNCQEERKYQSVQLQSKRNRRKKDELQLRDYFCGCGKSYLSYAALYTHLKQKHGGLQPEGTYEPEHGKGRKGRPKNELQNEEESFESGEMEGLSIYECGELDEMLYFLKNVGKNLKQELEDEMVGISESMFPKQIFLNQNCFIKIFDYFSSLLQQQEQEFVEMNANFLQMQNQEDNQVIYLKLNEIFAQFLISVFEFVTVECFEELAIFVCGLRYLINLNCQEVCPWCKLEFEFCEQDDMSQFIYSFIDCFEIEFENVLKKITDKQQFQLIGSKQQANYLFKHFINWMHYKKYVKEAIIIN